MFEGDWVNESLLAAAALMVMLAEVPLILASVTETVTVPALYKVIAPLDPAETAATPFVNVIAVAVPKLVAVPELFVTVGLNEPIVPAPLKVRLCEPL